MKKGRKIFIIIIVVFAVIAVGAYAFVKVVASGGLIDYNKDIQLTGLNSEVEVLRDQYGMAHIYADNEEDLYRAVGYVSASDRLWQMDLLRRVTQGRLSEIFGEDMTDADILFRALRISEKSKEILANCDPQLMKLLDAYVEGVNQYIQEGDLSFEFRVLGYKPEPWEAYHSVNLIGYMAWSLNSSWNTELTFFKLQQHLSQAHFDELIQSLDLETPVYPDFSLSGIPDDTTLLTASAKVKKLMPPVFSGSNNWAVAGTKSTTGKPILANDMHLGLMSPGVWTQMHHEVEGKLSVTGVVLPGQPFVIAGHNAHIAWGMTNVMLDDIDFYLETINPDDSSQYKFNGEWKNFETRTEKIAVKGGDTLTHTLQFTHRGPVISGMKNVEEQVISMKWLGNEPSNELRSVYLLNRAKNIDEFKDAVTTFISVAQNIVYADIEGNIGLYCCAGIPKRELPGWMVFPGDTDRYDWKEYVPFDSLPHIFNPEKGYVLSANNRTTSDKYPYYISAWFDLSNRYNRIEQMLNAKKQLSVDDFKDIQRDNHSLFAKNILPEIFKHLDESTFSETEQKAHQLLSDWDYVMHADQTAPLIFEEFYQVFAKNLLHDAMGDDLYKEFQRYGRLTNYMTDFILKNQNSVWCNNTNTPDKTETLSDIIQISFSQTADSLVQKYGKRIEKLQWGDWHKVKLEHPLGTVPVLDLAFNLNRKYSVGGSYHTVNPYSYNFGSGFDSKFGASQRHIFSLGNFDESKVMIPTGVSGIPASKHYLDQAEDFINGVYKTNRFTKQAVQEHAVYRMVFNP